MAGAGTDVLGGFGNCATTVAGSIGTLLAAFHEAYLAAAILAAAGTVLDDGSRPSRAPTSWMPV